MDIDKGAGLTLDKEKISHPLLGEGASIHSVACRRDRVGAGDPGGDGAVETGAGA